MRIRIRKPWIQVTICPIAGKNETRLPTVTACTGQQACKTGCTGSVTPQALKDVKSSGVIMDHSTCKIRRVVAAIVFDVVMMKSPLLQPEDPA